MESTEMSKHLPGFTAEVSLQRGAQAYRVSAGGSVSVQGNVYPAQGNPFACAVFQGCLRNHSFSQCSGYANQCIGEILF